MNGAQRRTLVSPWRMRCTVLLKRNIAFAWTSWFAHDRVIARGMTPTSLVSFHTARNRVNIFPLIGDYSIASKLTCVSECDVALEWYVLYILLYAKKHISGWNNVEQWKNQVHSVSHYQVMLVCKASVSRNSVKLIFRKFHSNFLNLKTYLGLTNTAPLLSGKLRLAFS